MIMAMRMSLHILKVKSRHMMNQVKIMNPRLVKSMIRMMKIMMTMMRKIMDGAGRIVVVDHLAIPSININNSLEIFTING